MRQRRVATALVIACVALLAAAPAALAAPPANDNFAAADAVTGASATIAGTTVEATKETGEPNHYGYTGGHSVWYRWTAPSDGTASIDTAGSGFTALLGVYTGTTVDGLTPIGSSYSTATYRWPVRFSAVAGREYMIAVDGYYGATGDLTLHVALSTPPANDNFAAAETLAGDSASATADVAAATREPGEPAHGGYGVASVWYEWTAPSDGGVVLSTEGSAQSTAVGVYTGTSVGALASVTGYSHPLGRISFRAVAGTTYRIAVEPYSASQLGEVELSLVLRPVPNNDMFAAATTLSGDASVAVTGRNDGASVEVGEPTHYGYSAPRNSVWYSWTAPKSGSATIKSAGGFTTTVAAYTGDTVSGLSRVTNQAQACGCGPSQIRIRVTAGVTYRIAVGTYYYYDDAAGDFTLSIDLIDSPPNDDFANAAPLVGVSAEVDGTNVGATQEPGEPIHDDNYYDPSVWYSWTAPSTMGATLDLAGSELNGVVAVYTGDSVDQLTRVTTTRVTGTTRPKRRFRAVGGVTYRIAVDGVRAEQGKFHLSLTTTPVPANDMFAAAEVLTGSSPSTSGNNVGATREYGEAGSRDATVWYAWTAPSNGVALVSLPTVDFTAGLAAYTGTTVEALNVVPSTSDYYGRTLRFRVTANTTYRIAVDGGSAPSRGEFTLKLDHKVSPANDDFAHAEALAGASATATGDTASATMEPGEPHHGYAWAGGSVWYSWTAASSGSVALSTAGSGQSYGVAVYTGTSVTSLARVASNYYSSNGSILRFRAVEGTTYRIAVETTSWSAPQNLKLALEEKALPPNDMFAAATTLPSAASVSVTGRNDGAGTELGEPAHHSYRAGGTSVWYSWTAPKSGSLTVKGSASTVLAAYTGSSISSLGRVANQSQPCWCGPEEIRLRVTAGVTYRIAVDGDSYYGGGGGDFTLGLTLADTPANDDFANAQVVAGASVDVDGTNVNATQEVGEPVHDDNYYDPSVWYSWTAPSTGGATIDTATSSLNAVVGVYTGDSVGALTRVSTTRTTGTVRAKRRFRAVAGTTYRIAVDGAGGAQGTFHLALRTTAPPANDMLASAEPLVGLSATASGNNIGATGEPNEPNPGGTAGASVWYSWTAPVDGAATVKLPTHDFAATASVYTGSDMASLQAAPGSRGYYYDYYYGDGLRFAADQGVTYRIAVHGGSLPSRGEFTLKLDETASPANDDFADADELTGLHDTRNATTVGATAETNEPSFSGGSASIWYRWTAPMDGRATIDLSGTSFYSTIGVFTGSSLDQLTSVSRTWGRYLSFKAAKGTTYRIVVDGEYGANGPVKLALSEVEVPPNDDFANATRLTGSVDGATGTNVNASYESWDPYVAGRYASASVWYRWRAPATGTVTIDTSGSAIDTLLGVYTGSSGWSLWTVASNDDADGTTQSRVTFDAAAGTVYRIFVGGATYAQGVVSVHVRHAASPANDAFADAEELSGDDSEVSGTNVGATREAGEPEHGGNPGGASVWYRWTAPADGTVGASVAPTGFSALLGVYSGTSVDSLTSLGAAGVPVTAGETYRIAVDGSNDGDGPMEGTFTLALDFTPQDDAGDQTVQSVAAPTVAEEPPGGADSGDQPQDESPPVTEQPKDESPPVTEQPTSDPPAPAEQQSTDSSANDPPVDDPPVNDPPASDPTAEDETGNSEPVEEPPAQPPADDPPADQPPASNDAPADTPKADPPAPEPPTDTRQPSGGDSGDPPAREPDGGTAPTPPPGWSADLLASATFHTQKIATVLKRGLVGTVKCSRACRVSGSLTLGGRRLGTAVSAAAAPSGKRTRLVLRLSRSGKRALKRAGSARVKVTVKARAGGQSAVVTKRVKLRR